MKRGSMSDFERYELRRKFIDDLSDREWELISDSLFELQSLRREECRERNCGDKEWSYVDRLYGLYIDICTFVTGK